MLDNNKGFWLIAGVAAVALFVLVKNNKSAPTTVEQVVPVPESTTSVDPNSAFSEFAGATTTDLNGTGTATALNPVLTLVPFSNN